MSLRFRNGRYWIDIYTDGRKGRRIQRRLPEGTTAEEAESAHADLMRRHRKRIPAGVELGLSVSSLCAKYLTWYELHRMPRTVTDCRAVFEGPIESHLGGLEAELLEQGDIQAYQRERLLTVKARTANKELAYLSGALRWAEKRGMISLRGWKMEMLPYSKPIPRPMSPDEVRRIIDAAEPFYQAFFLFMYACGMRINEVRSLKWADLDLDNRTVTVYGKGGRFRRLPLPGVVGTGENRLQGILGLRFRARPGPARAEHPLRHRSGLQKGGDRTARQGPRLQAQSRNAPARRRRQPPDDPGKPRAFPGPDHGNLYQGR